VLLGLLPTPLPPLTIDARSFAYTVVEGPFCVDVGMLKYALSFPLTLGVAGVVGCVASALVVTVLEKGMASWRTLSKSML
jgi:hypothetical protein